MGSELVAELFMPYQHEAVQKMVQFLEDGEEHACYNCCEQGLGKSAQALAALWEIAEKQAVERDVAGAPGAFFSTLIICPAVMRLTWAAEIEMWTDWECFVISSQKDLDNYEGQAIVITSYDLARKELLIDYLGHLHFDALILDEAHFLKNRQTQRAKSCLQFYWEMVEYRIGLSGTPFTKNVVDGFSMFSKMLPKKFPNYYQFAKKYAWRKVTPWAVEYIGLKNPKGLSKIIRKNFFIRYNKKDVLKELPDKRFQTIFIDEKYSVKAKAKAVKDADMKALLLAVEDETAAPMPPNHAEHMRLQGEAKVKPICDFVKQMLEEGIPVSIFAYHKSVIAAYIQYFKKYEPATITGATPEKLRHAHIKRFQNGDTLLGVWQIIAAGTGITLTAGSNVVLAELVYSPAVISQAIDRHHRIGQKEQVNVYYFVTRGSLDEKVSKVVLKRAREFKSILDGN